MLLSSLLDPPLITTRVKATSYEEVIEALLSAIFANHQIQDSYSTILEAIKSREQLGGTVLPEGLAVPHARIDLLQDIIVAVATLKSPIDQAGVEVRMIVLILTSRTTSNLYLNSLSAFARLAQNPETFAKVTAATSAEEFITLVQGTSIEVRKELTVEHIMNPDPISVGPDDTLTKVIDLFVEHDLNYLPVLGPDRKFLGELSALDILKLGIPNYAQLIGNMNRIKTFEPLEDLLEKESMIHARDVLEMPAYSFGHLTSITEAVSVFTRTRRRYIPVIEDGKLLGLVNYMQILKRVLRG